MTPQTSRDSPPNHITSKIKEVGSFDFYQIGPRLFSHFQKSKQDIKKATKKTIVEHLILFFNPSNKQVTTTILWRSSLNKCALTSFHQKLDNSDDEKNGMDTCYFFEMTETGIELERDSHKSLIFRVDSFQKGLKWLRLLVKIKMIQMNCLILNIFDQLICMRMRLKWLRSRWSVSSQDQDDTKHFWSIEWYW